MSHRALVLTIAVTATLAGLYWTAQHTRTKGVEAALRKVRSFNVGLTWARFDNWRLDLGQPPCVWNGERDFPFVDQYTVTCSVGGKTVWRFEVTGAEVVRAADAHTQSALSKLKRWAKDKGRWP